MNGVRAPAGGLARRLLRRSALVAACAGAGWLLTALFAGGASAAPAPSPVEDEVPVTAQAASPAGQPASHETAPADDSTTSPADEATPADHSTAPANNDATPGHSTAPPTHENTPSDDSAVPPADQATPTQSSTHEGAPATTGPAIPADRPTHEAAPVATPPAAPADRPTHEAAPVATPPAAPADRPTHEAAAATIWPAAPTGHPAQPPTNSAHAHAQEVAPVAELFAALAPVPEPPAHRPIPKPPVIGPTALIQPVLQNNSLLSGLLGGLTNTVGTITESVVGTVDAAVSVLPVVIVPPTDEPDGFLPELPQLLPILGTDPEALPAGDPAARAAPLAPAAPRGPPPATTATPVPEHTPGQAAFSASPQRTPDKAGGAARGTAAEHANESSVPRPVKVPAPAPAPAGGPTASTVHDNSAGARGTHGVLAVQTSLEPSAAGFTTRSRATGISGRIAGLPATSPD